MLHLEARRNPNHIFMNKPACFPESQLILNTVRAASVVLTTVGFVILVRVCISVQNSVSEEKPSFHRVCQFVLEKRSCSLNFDIWGVFFPLNIRVSLESQTRTRCGFVDGISAILPLLYWHDSKPLSQVIWYCSPLFRKSWVWTYSSEGVRLSDISQKTFL